jgi:hypothetical protein
MMALIVTRTHTHAHTRTRTRTRTHTHIYVYRTLLQHGFFYTRENKCKLLFGEHGKFDYTRSAKHAVSGI